MTVHELKNLFFYAYNQEPDAVYFVPGRINLIGEHIELAIDSISPPPLSFGIYLILRKNDENCFKFWSLNEPEAISIEIDQQIPEGINSWIKHPLIVINKLINSGVELKYGYDMLFWGNIPSNADLLPSDSLEIITNFALRDQLHQCHNNISTVIDIRNDKHKLSFINWDMIQLNPREERHENIATSTSGVKVVISNTHTPHKCDISPYFRRISECKAAFEYLNKIRPLHELDELTEDEFNSMISIIDNPVAIISVYHIISEVFRTKKAVEVLNQCDLNLFGLLMNEAHTSLRDNLGIVSPEVDSMVETAWEIEGVIGSRMIGCGLGAGTVSLVREEAINVFVEQVGTAYESQTGIKPQFFVAEIGDVACKLN